jgi:hypothetical protein
MFPETSPPHNDTAFGRTVALVRWRNSSRMEAITRLSSTRPMGNIKGKQAAIDEPIALEIFTDYV